MLGSAFLCILRLSNCKKCTGYILLKILHLYGAQKQRHRVSGQGDLNCQNLHLADNSVSAAVKEQC